tara:strand:+ start:6090 stop:6437 length:348 start_codon:yes stop_codon:yes gene_type:complete
MQNIIFMLWVLFFPGLVFADQKVWEKDPIVPPPDEIRSTKTQPNRLMEVTYANGRTFIFEIKAMNLRSDCNEIQINSTGEIKIITRAQSNTFEYILGSPIMFSRWLRFFENIEDR